MMTERRSSTISLNGLVARLFLLVLLAATVLAVPVHPLADEEDLLTADHRHHHVRLKRSKDINDNVVRVSQFHILFPFAADVELLSIFSGNIPIIRNLWAILF